MKKNIIKKISQHLKIVETVSNDERHKQGLKRLGRGFSEAYRFNPYNPISYIVLIVIFIIGILMYGFVGFFQKIEIKSPFIWD